MGKSKCASEYLHIRVTEEEKKRILKTAQDMSTTVSQLCRTLLLAADAERNAKALDMYETIEKNMK